MDDTAATAAEIEVAFGGRWGVWLSGTGRWWGARTQPLSTEESNAGCVPFVHAPDPAELTARLHEQDSLLETLTPGADLTHHGGKDPATTEDMTLDDLRRIYASRWEIAPITGGYRAESRSTGSHRPVPRYGRSPAELAESIRIAETAP